MIEETNKRIGLTSLTDSKLDELLIHLNPKESEEGKKLIKFDLYRLAVALGIKNSIQPPPLSDKSTATLRVFELDQDQMLYTVIENSKLNPEGLPIYEFIERLAETGIQKFYLDYQKRGEIPFEEYLS